MSVKVLSSRLCPTGEIEQNLADFQHIYHPMIGRYSSGALIAVLVTTNHMCRDISPFPPGDPPVAFHPDSGAQWLGPHSVGLRYVRRANKFRPPNPRGGQDLNREHRPLLDPPPNRCPRSLFATFLHGLQKLALSRTVPRDN